MKASKIVRFVNLVPAGTLTGTRRSSQGPESVGAGCTRCASRPTSRGWPSSSRARSLRIDDDA
jgi:hypothetical protein